MFNTIAYVPREDILGQWIGNTGTLFLSDAFSAPTWANGFKEIPDDNFVDEPHIGYPTVVHLRILGIYDWRGFPEAGWISGRLSSGILKFKWGWTKGPETGTGILIGRSYADGAIDTLEGGWFTAEERSNPDDLGADLLSADGNLFLRAEVDSLMRRMKHQWTFKRR